MIFIGPTSGASSIDIHDNGLSNNDVDSSTKTTYLDTGILSTDEVTNLEEGIRGIEHKYKRTHSHPPKNHRNLRNHRTTSAHTNNVGDILYNHEAIVGRALTECTDHVTCAGGYGVGTNNQVTCEEACQGQNGEQLCCDGTYFDPDGYPYQACDGFTGRVCKDGSCSGHYSCYYANIDSVVNSCIGKGSCKEVAYRGGKVTEIVNSCEGLNSCYYLAAQKGKIGTVSSSCNKESSCEGAAAYNGFIADITSSCNDLRSCIYVAAGCYDTDYYCDYRSAGGSVGHILRSCLNVEACYDMAAYEGNV